MKVYPECSRAYLRKIYKGSGPSNGITEAEFFEQIKAIRGADPNFLEPLGTGKENRQLRIVFTGGTYEIARLTDQMSRSYLLPTFMPDELPSNMIGASRLLKSRWVTFREGREKYKIVLPETI